MLPRMRMSGKRYRCWGIAFDAIEMAYEVTRPLNEWMSHPTAKTSTTAIQNHSRMMPNYQPDRLRIACAPQ
jgi:hypothetical protein